MEIFSSFSLLTAWKEKFISRVGRKLSDNFSVVWKLKLIDPSMLLFYGETIGVIKIFFFLHVD